MDPATRGLVDVMTAAFPDIGGQVTDAAEARRILAAQPRPPVEPLAMAEVSDRTVPGPEGAPDVPVRVYRPHGADSPAPVLVFFHGGGFVICDLDSHDGTVRLLAERTGAVVVSVDYRRAPEDRWPAAAEDCYAVTRWVAAHAAELGVDPRRLVVAGDSAGGNLAAVVALMARDRGGPDVAFQLLVYPVTDAAMDSPSYAENGTGNFLTAVHMRWYWAQYLGPDGDGAHPYASPLRAPDLSGLPPAYVVTAEYDPLRDEGMAYARRLTEAGVAATARCYPGMFHGFFGFTELLPPAAEAVADATAAIRAALTERQNGVRS